MAERTLTYCPINYMGAPYYDTTSPQNRHCHLLVCQMPKIAELSAPD